MTEVLAAWSRHSVGVLRRRFYTPYLTFYKEVKLKKIRKSTVDHSAMIAKVLSKRPEGLVNQVVRKLRRLGPDRFVEQAVAAMKKNPSLVYSSKISDILPERNSLEILKDLFSRGDFQVCRCIIKAVADSEIRPAEDPSAQTSLKEWATAQDVGGDPALNAIVASILKGEEHRLIFRGERLCDDLRSGAVLEYLPYPVVIISVTGDETKWDVAATMFDGAVHLYPIGSVDLTEKARALLFNFNRRFVALETASGSIDFVPADYLDASVTTKQPLKDKSHAHKMELGSHASSNNAGRKTSGASIRPHARRAFIRNQPCGPKLSMKRLTFVRSTWVKPGMSFEGKTSLRKETRTHVVYIHQDAAHDSTR